CSLQEDHREPIFCVTFNNFDMAHRDVFATVGQHRVRVRARGRRGSEAGSGGGAEGDIGEKFYCCKWSVDEESGAALLLLAGEKALVRVLDVSRGYLVHTFAGHGKVINDIAVHPSRPRLFLSAAEDESIRLWNIRSRTCVAIFAGEGGHRNKVLSLDFHPWDGERFLSAGMDNAVKIWSLAPIERLIDESDAAVDGCVDSGEGGVATAAGLRRAFPTRVVQQPLFSTLQVHNDYVDCVRWLGDLVLSKSVHDVITLWRPGGHELHLRPPPNPSSSPMQNFKLSDSHRTWFVRFSCDVQYSVLACGSARGKVFVFSLLATTLAGTEGAPRAKLTAPQCKVVVRQTAVSYDGTTILASCDDGSVHRWDRDNSMEVVP
ncbi:polycomb group protein, partial [Volvox carteri f. nagariensis]